MRIWVIHHGSKLQNSQRLKERASILDGAVFGAKHHPGVGDA